MIREELLRFGDGRGAFEGLGAVDRNLRPDGRGPLKQCELLQCFILWSMNDVIGYFCRHEADG